MRVGKTVVFDGKMDMRKFGSAAPPFGKVACAVKVSSLSFFINLIGCLIFFNYYIINLLPLYEGLTKAESTVAFLLQTEIIGLNAWLASIHIPNITPQCTYRWPT